MPVRLPVLSSTFPVFRKIIESNGFGICAHSQNPQSMASAIEAPVSNDEKAEEKDNWDHECKKPLTTHSHIFGSQTPKRTEAWPAKYYIKALTPPIL